MRAKVEERREATDPHCMTGSQAEERLAGAPWRRFLVLGDEIAAGRGEAVPGYGTGGWADRVAAGLRRVQPDLAYLNLGRSGRLAADVRSQQLARALEFKPDLTALMCCQRELSREPFDANAVEAEFGRIITPLRDSGGDVLIVGWFDSSRCGHRQDQERQSLRLRIRELAERKQAVALRHGVIYVDLSGHPAGAERGLFGADGSVPTTRSHAIAAASVIHGLGAHLAMTDD